MKWRLVFFKRRLVDRVKSFVIILSEPLKLNYRRKSKRERERVIKVKIYNTFDSGIARLFSSIQFSHSVMSNSLWPHGLLQNTRLPCPSPTPGVYSNSCPLSQWCHPTISSSVVPFSSYLQSFPAPGSFQMSQFFTSGGQSIGVLASASVLPKNIQVGLL